MATQEQAYSEIEKLMKSFKGFPSKKAVAPERQIHQVYILHGLTKEEVKIVEGK
jgi:hypothetical protein